MQHSAPTPAETPRRDETPAPGPVELDPKLFAQVAGGAPRNGWQATTNTTVASTDAPRNGWY